MSPEHAALECKSRRRWPGLFAVFGLGLVSGFGLALASYYLVAADPPAAPPEGTLPPDGSHRASTGGPAEPLLAVDPIQALPYLQGYKPAPVKVGVSVYKRERVQPGNNLLCRGDRAMLMDMQSRPLHQWQLPTSQGREIVRVHAYPNGDLLALVEDEGLQRVSWDSRPIWRSDLPAHHDMSLAEDGTITVLTRTARQRQTPRGPVEHLEDGLAALDDSGRTLWSVSLLDALNRSETRFREHIQRLISLHPVRGVLDPLHTNSVFVIPGPRAAKGGPFRPGNILLSMLQSGMVTIFDPQEKRLTWQISHLWSSTHDAKVLDNGHLLLVDNGGSSHRSRVLEVDPLNQQVVWQYGGELEHPFSVTVRGRCDRLANGNTLIVEATSGRAFEVTPDREIVWDYTWPQRSGERAELVSVLSDLHRLPPGYFQGRKVEL